MSLCDKYDIVSLLTVNKLAKSGAEARRLIDYGAAKINGKVVRRYGIWLRP